MKPIGRRKAPSAAVSQMVVEIEPLSDRDECASRKGEQTAARRRH
jgi:hypothetical protein